MQFTLYLKHSDNSPHMKYLFLALILHISFYTLNAQSCSNTYPGGAQNWSALSWSCTGGGTSPAAGGTFTENLSIATIGNGDNLTINVSLTLTGNLSFSSSGSNPTITIPAGVTVVINGNFTDNDNNVNYVVNGTLIVTGTFKGKNNAVFSGTGTVSGGTLDLGNGASCSGGCPSLNFNTCSQGDAFCTSNVTSGTTYSWNGSASSNWQTASNWTPTRTTPGTNDYLTFTSSGANKSITNVPSQTVGNILVTGSSAYSFTPAASGNTLTLSKTSGNALQIDNGSTLSIGATSNTLNLTLPSGGKGSIGGQLNLVVGTFTINGATLILHTNSTPLARTSGQVTANSSTTLRFGDTGYTSGSTIVLPSSIFNGSPTISTIVMNRTNGATLGNQTITVNSTATFTLGVLNTNSTGQIRFSSSAVSVAESASSYINGYAQMGSTSVGTGALNYLGMSIASGANNIGSVTITRRTGTNGVNTFNGNTSIAASWDVTATADPAAGRNISFSWLAAFDNASNSTLRFQTYSNTGSGFNPVGSLQLLSSAGPPRQSASVSTTVLNNATFTLSDENNTLPVSLTEFTATQDNADILLEWTTSSELNFDFFSIEKSLDGMIFQEIGTVKGHGTTNQANNYTLRDKSPIIGKNYYRLKSVDLDRYTEYFKIISVDYTQEKQFSLYPNPTEGKSISIKINFPIDEPYNLIILDNLGSEVGRLTDTQPDATLIFTKPLSNGLYYARFATSSFAKTVRFIVQN